MAAILHVSPKTVRRWIGLNWLKVTQNRIPEESVARFVRQYRESIGLPELPIEIREMLARLDQSVPRSDRRLLSLDLAAAAGV